MKLILLIILFISSFFCYSQKIYSVNYSNQADVKVFVVKYINQADLNVFKVQYANQANENKGLWYFVNYSNQADKKFILLITQIKVI